jgi:hypothetical protein
MHSCSDGAGDGCRGLKLVVWQDRTGLNVATKAQFQHAGLDAWGAQVAASCRCSDQQRCQRITTYIWQASKHVGKEHGLQAGRQQAASSVTEVAQGLCRRLQAVNR